VGKKSLFEGTSRERHHLKYKHFFNIRIILGLIFKFSDRVLGPAYRIGKLAHFFMAPRKEKSKLAIKNPALAESLLPILWYGKGKFVTVLN
jgi:hypothetical protein